MNIKREILTLVMVTVAAAALHAGAQSPPTPYPTMAPVNRYLIANRSVEIALARTAAPASISGKAKVMVLGRDGFQVAVPGTNHFVCLVERSWDAAIGDPNFWNPHIRGPDCFNAAAARTFLPIVFMKTRLALAGKSQAQIDAAMQVAFNQKKLPALEPGAMCYMLSKESYVSDQARNWHPHLMFFVPLSMGKAWGANLAGSAVLSSDDASDRLTIYLIPVARWSDGTLDPKG
ncbi:MAG: hypothetical protein ACRD01_00510 [Terriglobales bacterium]